MSIVSISAKLLLLTLTAAAAMGGCLYADGDGERSDAGRKPTPELQIRRQVFKTTQSPSTIGTAYRSFNPPPDADTADEEVEFATGISLYTCDYDPPRLTLPRGHFGRNCEMTAVATAYRDDGGDVYDVSIPLVWSSDAPWATIEPFAGNHHGTLVYGRSSIDLFDLGIATEPEATVEVCAKNDCPDAAADCRSEVCREIKAYAVVNLEGDWCMSGATFYEACSEHSFVQDGRHLTVRDVYGYQIGYGGIMQTVVSWDESDVLYVGTIDPSRDLIRGQAYWQMSDEYAGEWQATRLPGQEH